LLHSIQTQLVTELPLCAQQCLQSCCQVTLLPAKFATLKDNA